MLPNSEDTIAGIATAPGEAGVGIIRISGKQALEKVDPFFRAKSRVSLTQQKNYTLAYGWIMDQESTIDEVLISVMRGPHSYTAEDVLEINCHGGGIVTQEILELLLGSGIRIANPGEFTQRAFENGRIDLTKAEAIRDLVEAKTRRGASQAVNQLKGKLYEKILKLKEAASWVLALVNASIDFPDEDVIFTNKKEVEQRLDFITQELERLIQSAELGRIIREGFRVVLVGEPNVGKSSIMNCLLGEKRSIVTHIPGTTRDIIEEYVNIQGVPVSLTDTAGIRETEDIVEKEGIERAKSAITKADLILWIVDSSAPKYDFAEHSEVEDTPILLVCNKNDLHELSPQELAKVSFAEDTISISVKKEQDLVLLREKIYEFATGTSENRTEGVVLTNIRQKNAAETALESVETATSALEEGMGEEFLAVDLSRILDNLGNIVGETTPDDMLNQIFSNFCIGK